MRILRFLHNAVPSWGVLEGSNSVRLLPGILDMTDLIAHCHQTEATPISLSPSISSELLALDSLTLLPPVQPLRNIFCVGWNYLQHYDESMGKREGQDVPLPDRPTLFTKLPSTLAGPEDDLPLQQHYTNKLDWEVELAVIIGIGGKDITEQEALSHVFAYTVANDISARDLQRAHGAQWFKGKSLDATCPMGPLLVTANELSDPQNLDIRCYVNDMLMQSSHTSRQIFSVARVISEISTGLTLQPGDIILTGTPEGIGAARTPPIFIQDGDIVRCEISEIGQLRNRFFSQLRDARAPTYS